MGFQKKCLIKLYSKKYSKFFVVITNKKNIQNETNRISIEYEKKYIIS